MKTKSETIVRSVFMNTVLKGLVQKCREILGDRPGPDGRGAELLGLLSIRKC